MISSYHLGEAVSSDDREVRINLSAKGHRLNVFLTDDHKGDQTSCQLTNVSRTGMFLQTSSTLEKGKHYNFNLRTQGGKAIRGRLHVCWNRTKAEGPYLPVGVGAQVTEFFEETDTQWFQFIEKNLTSVTLSDLFTQNLIKAKGQETCAKVLAKMTKAEQSIAIIIDAKGKPIGVFSHDDIIKNAQQPDFLEAPVSKYMQKEQLYLDINDDLASAFRHLKDQKRDHLTITENGVLVGLVTIGSVVPYWWEASILREKRLKARLRSAVDLIAHDLRNPISIIQTTNSLLQTSFMTPQDFLESGMPEMIERNCEVLLSLIEDLISEGSEEEIRQEFTKQTIDLAELAEMISTQYQYQAKRKGITMTFSKEDVNIWVHVDPRRMEQVLANLISNAIKYSDREQKIFVSVGKKNKKAYVRVEDTGQGIKAEELPRIFDKYCKISSLPTSGETSTGLGLSIAKRLVEAHDGDISVESEEGKGTSFEVHLPLISAEGPLPNQLIN